MNRICGIYLITHTESGRKYVGQSVDIRRRINDHARGCSPTRIGCAVRKYGWPAFSIETLELCNQDELNAAEMKWVQHHDCVSPRGFNLTSGGSLQKKYSAETKAKIGAANARRIVTAETRAKLRAKTCTDETKAKISAARTGKKASEATKLKISAASTLRAPIAIAHLAAFNTGKKNSQQTKDKRAAHHIGAKRSADTCAKISAALKAVEMTPERLERLQKMSAANKGKPRSASAILATSIALKGVAKSPEHIAKSVAAKAANRIARAQIAQSSLLF